MTQSICLGAVIGLVVLLSISAEAAIIRVPGDHATVQAAIDAAAAGDIVEITDSRVYEEDLNIQKTITLRGATGQSPIIRTANTAQRFGHLGIAGIDYFGTLVRAPGVLLENLAFENLEQALNNQNVSSALVILAPNCTLRNIRITTLPDVPGDALGGLIADLDIPLGGATPTGVLIEDCMFVTNKYGFAVSYFVVAQNLPQVTFRNCTFKANSSTGLEIDSGNLTVENCLFEDNPGNAIDVGGGHAEVINSVFRRNGTTASAGINLNMDGRSFGNWPAIPPGNLRLYRCRIYDNGSGGVPAVLVREGTLIADNSIFALNNGPHIVLNSAGRVLAPGQVYINNCDFYKSVASHELEIKGGGEQEIVFDMKNSIVTEADGGFFVIATEFPETSPEYERINANYSAFYEQWIPFLEIGGSNNLLFESGEPPYNSTDPTDPDAFRLPENNMLLTAGEEGTYMGSRGFAVQPEPVTLQIAIAQGLPTLSWLSLNGVTYDVRERTSLTEGDWTIVDSVAGDGAVKTWAPSQAPDANRYWQLLAR